MTAAKKQAVLANLEQDGSIRIIESTLKGWLYIVEQSTGRMVIVPKARDAGNTCLGTPAFRLDRKKAKALAKDLLGVLDIFLEKENPQGAGTPLEAYERN